MKKANWFQKTLSSISFLNVNRTLSLTENQRQTIWSMFGSFFANSLVTQGNGLITNSYEKNIDVFSLIKKIIDISKSLTWIVEQQQSDGTWKEVKNTTIHDLMLAPNESKGYSWNDIEEQLILFLLCTGNAYMYGQTRFNSTLIEEVDILPSGYVRIYTNQDFFMPEVKYNFFLGGSNRDIEKESIAHIKFFRPAFNNNLESMYGLSPIQVASAAIQVGNDRWEADANLLQNRGAIGLITDKSNRPMTKEEGQKVQKDFQDQTGGPNKFGMIKVTNKDLNYIQMAMSPADLQLLEKGVITLRHLCNVFGIDSSLFNDPENKTYSNRTEAEKAMYTNAIMPLSDKIAEHLTRFLVRNHYPGKAMRMRQDFSNIECLQEDFKDKSTTWGDLKVKGIYTANEVREKLGDKPSVDENADKLIVSSNSSLVEELKRAGEANHPPAGAAK